MLPKRRLKRMNYSFICLKKTIFVPHNYAKAQDIIEALDTNVNSFRNGAEPNDDLTMMCIKLL
jgi:hypothetical protein